jgi:hypothetical protein
VQLRPSVLHTRDGSVLDAARDMAQAENVPHRTGLAPVIYELAVMMAATVLCAGLGRPAGRGRDGMVRTAKTLP